MNHNALNLSYYLISELLYDLMIIFLWNVQDAASEWRYDAWKCKQPKQKPTVKWNGIRTISSLDDEWETRNFNIRRTMILFIFNKQHFHDEEKIKVEKFKWSNTSKHLVHAQVFMKIFLLLFCWSFKVNWDANLLFYAYHSLLFLLPFFSFCTLCCFMLLKWSDSCACLTDLYSQMYFYW